MAHHSAFMQGLRQAGCRLTPQREMILSVICESGGHLTAEDVLKRVRTRYPYIGKSAVYRTLDLLTRLNFINQADFGGGRIEYELHQTPRHHHLLCRQCGRRIQVAENIFAPLEKTLLAQYGFAADLEHFAIYGTCSKCGAAVRKPGKIVKRQVTGDVKLAT